MFGMLTFWFLSVDFKLWGSGSVAARWCRIFGFYFCLWVFRFARQRVCARFFFFNSIFVWEFSICKTVLAWWAMAMASVGDGGSVAMSTFWVMFSGFQIVSQWWRGSEVVAVMLSSEVVGVGWFFFLILGGRFCWCLDGDCGFVRFGVVVVIVMVVVVDEMGWMPVIIYLVDCD